MSLESVLLNVGGTLAVYLFCNTIWALLREGTLKLFYENKQDQTLPLSHLKAGLWLFHPWATFRGELEALKKRRDNDRDTFVIDVSTGSFQLILNLFLITFLAPTYLLTSAFKKRHANFYLRGLATRALAQAKSDDEIAEIVTSQAITDPAEQAQTRTAILAAFKQSSGKNDPDQ